MYSATAITVEQHAYRTGREKRFQYRLIRKGMKKAVFDFQNPMLLPTAGVMRTAHVRSKNKLPRESRVEVVLHSE
jgi:hypothetical protein